MRNLFLPGVPEDLLRVAFDRAGGNEIASGKFESSESSAALAANAFGWFYETPELLPPLPQCSDLDWPALRVEVEQEMRFPWRGGGHPWLDACVETQNHVVGIESKRFEPFRGAKPASMSEAYDRDIWGEAMEPWRTMRDSLRKDPVRFRHLDAAQLVKHALGLATEAGRRGKQPVLHYLFAEPESVALERRSRHREEITRFAREVQGARVRFAYGSYREWLAEWTGDCAVHASALVENYAP